jgi:NAD(P)-dependent dehydrogenase (short-subunit alcohol dehydrogenase family)
MGESEKGSMMQSLTGKVAVVTGSSRNGGRGIALALGEAGATVYVTGRSVTGKSTSDDPSATIDHTAALVTERGGTAITVQVDHTDDEQVKALFERVQREQERLDILVNNAWGGYEMADGFGERKLFWELPLRQWELMHNAGLRSHMVASRFAIPLMLPRRQGLIVNTTTSIPLVGKCYPHLFYDTFKIAINRMTLGMAEQCRPYGITVVALSLGDEKLFMRTWEVDPDTEIDPNAPFQTFSPEYAGRAVVALAVDQDVMRWSGQTPYLEVPALAREYGFTDIDGRQP